MYTAPYFDDEFIQDETRSARDADGKYYTVSASMKYPEKRTKCFDEPKEK